MKKAMTLPAFFGIYGLIWLCLALTMDYIPLVMFLIRAMIAAALGYSVYTLLTSLAEIRRIKRDWADTFSARWERALRAGRFFMKNLSARPHCILQARGVSY